MIITSINISEAAIKSSNSEKLLGVTMEIVISLLVSMFIVSVEKLAKYYMLYVEYHNIYHKLRSKSCSKHL